MSEAQGKFALLLDLAKETSSEKRRDLLRQVTDVFVQDDDARTDKEAELFDEIFTAVSADMEVTVRAELAKKIAKSNAPLNRTARRLAMSEIEVARPVIEKSRALSEHDILEVIESKGQDHMLAVTKRDDIGERVSSALIDKGEDNVVVSLLENRSARIDRETFEKSPSAPATALSCTPHSSRTRTPPSTCSTKSTSRSNRNSAAKSCGSSTASLQATSLMR